MNFASGASLGIMQPYFFPYWGHFCLIASTDAWIVFDTPQYKPKSWMNRNRVLHPNDGWQYLSVPLSNSSINIKVSDALVNSPKLMAQSLVNKLGHYRKRAPFFKECLNVLETAFNLAKDDRLVSLNVACLLSVCKYLEIPFNYRLASELDLGLPTTLGPGLWAPNIAAALGTSAYVNPIAGRELFNPIYFRDLGVTLSFLKHDELVYDCDDYVFVPALSIIDTMMWLPANLISEAIFTRYEIVHTT